METNRTPSRDLPGTRQVELASLEFTPSRYSDRKTCLHHSPLLSWSPRVAKRVATRHESNESFPNWLLAPVLSVTIRRITLGQSRSLALSRRATPTRLALRVSLPSP